MPKTFVVTPWYPGDAKPVRKGVYQRKYSSGAELYCYWDGALWHGGAWTIEKAMSDQFFQWASISQGLKWRGMKK